MLIGQTGGLRDAASERCVVGCSVEVFLKCLKALDDFGFSQKVLDWLSAGVAELQAKGLARR